MAGIRSRFSPHITDDTSVLEKPLSAWEHIFAAQTNLPKPSPTPETLLQDIDWEQCIDIRDFGALINGGDDSEAIRAAIRYGKRLNTNVLICLPPGTIGIGSPVKIPSNVHLHGAGKNLTYLKATASMAAVLTGEDTAVAGTDLIQNVIFSGFTIEGTSFATRCVGPLQNTGSVPAAVFYTLTLVDFRMFGATAVNFMATTDNSLLGNLVGLDVATSNCGVGMVLHYGQVLLLDYDGGDTSISLNLVGIGDGSVIQGRSNSPTFVYIDNAGLGGSGAVTSAHMILVHEGTGPTIDVEDVFGGLDDCIIHITAAGPHATNPIVDWNTPTSSPNQIKGNFVTIVGDVSTRPGVAYGTQVGNNTYNVVHHLLPASTAPKYTGTIGNNSVNLDLLTLGGAASVFAPSDADYLVGTAHAGLSAEIVVGTTPGGELGGTWGSPTVDATHSGSAHHAQGHDHTTADGSGVLTKAEHDDYDEHAEIVTPATPAAGKGRFYPKDVRGVSHPYWLPASGVEYQLDGSFGRLVADITALPTATGGYNPPSAVSSAATAAAGAWGSLAPVTFLGATFTKASINPGGSYAQSVSTVGAGNPAGLESGAALTILDNVPLFLAKFSIGTSLTTRVFVGLLAGTLTTAVAADDPGVEHVGVQMVVGSANWRVTHSDGSAATTVDTGIAKSNGIKWVSIEQLLTGEIRVTLYDSAGLVQFSTDITTDSPAISTNLTAAVGGTRTGATAATFRNFYVGITEIIGQL